MNSHNTGVPAPGWYPDPLDPASERLWEGERWSEQTRPAAAISSLPPPAAAAPLSVGTDALGRDPSHGSQPIPPPPPHHQVDDPPTGSSGRPSGGSMIGLGLGLFALLLVGGCVVALVAAPLIVRSQDTFEDEVGFEIAEPVPPPVITTTEPFALEQTTTAGPGMPGFDGSAAVFGYGAVDQVPVTLDTGEPLLFDVTVGEPVDITDEVLAANPLNAEPLEGVVHAAIPVTVVVVESPTDPFPAADAFDWTIIGGATAARYRPAELDSDQFGCGVIDDALAAFDEMSIGIEYAGRVCIAIPGDDLVHPDTRVGLTIGLGEPFVWSR